MIESSTLTSAPNGSFVACRHDCQRINRPSPVSRSSGAWNHSDKPSTAIFGPNAVTPSSMSSGGEASLSGGVRSFIGGVRLLISGSVGRVSFLTRVLNHRSRRPKPPGRVDEKYSVFSSAERNGPETSPTLTVSSSWVGVPKFASSESRVASQRRCSSSLAAKTSTRPSALKRGNPFHAPAKPTFTLCALPKLSLSVRRVASKNCSGFPRVKNNERPSAETKALPSTSFVLISGPSGCGFSNGSDTEWRRVTHKF